MFFVSILVNDICKNDVPTYLMIVLRNEANDNLPLDGKYNDGKQCFKLYYIGT